MHGFYCTRRCVQQSQNRILFLKALHARRFARRSSPGFSGFNPSGAPQSPPDRNVNKPPTQPHVPPREERATGVNNPEVTTPPPRTRFRSRAGKLIFVAIVAFLGYKVNEWQKNPARSVILNPRFYYPFILESRKKVSSTSSILDLLSLPSGQNTENVSEAWRTGVWSVLVIQPELQIARPYTPLPPLEDTEPELVRLFVRQEPQGEVSTMLHKINRGTIVSLRGPRVEYEIPDDIDEILFLAGGTGIAPALQVAHTLFNHRTKTTGQDPELRILWANRRREDSINGLDPLSQRAQAGLVPKTGNLTDRWRVEPPSQPKQTTEEGAAPSPPSQTRLVDEVESLKARHRGKMIVDYFTDEEGSYISEGLLRTYLSGADQTANQDGTPRRKVILISGPEGFVDVFAGPKTWQRGIQTQGPLGGLLKKIDPQGWEIWKL